MLQQNPIQTQGRYQVRQAISPQDIADACALRQRGFGLAQPDRDKFDDTSLHMLVEDTRTGELRCCFRLRVLTVPDDCRDSYCAQYYDFSALFDAGAPLVELGRFCVEPGIRDADILRIAWGALTAFVDGVGAHMLIGCTSFAGTDPDRYGDVFSVLATRHLAPRSWQLATTTPSSIDYVDRYARAQDEEQALAQMPPLLRSYLAMGGRVGDHAVIDRHMDTLHVFTGLEITAIPESRKRLLRALAR
ncbi:GNAT family N-acetyltransferase [Sedimentitalea sp. XS_ASV28]|uniref:GNAT family N-acetyltransferase n=1 Tax=Sedimentitalea sp. XS_ASV28 TaxID=3241296 RepID=UPI00351721ED